jgi:hypothetical protein
VWLNCSVLITLMTPSFLELHANGGYGLSFVSDADRIRSMYDQCLMRDPLTVTIDMCPCLHSKSRELSFGLLALCPLGYHGIRST